MSTQAAAVDFATPRFDFKNMESGYEYTHEFVVKDADGALSDITGWTEVEMEVTTMDGDPVFTLDTSDGITINSGASTITFTFSAARTGAMNGNYKHKTDATPGSGVVTPLIRGCINVT